MGKEPWHEGGSLPLHWCIPDRLSCLRWEEFVPIFLLQEEADGAAAEEEYYDEEGDGY